MTKLSQVREDCLDTPTLLFEGEDAFREIVFLFSHYAEELPFARMLIFSLIVEQFDTGKTYWFDKEATSFKEVFSGSFEDLITVGKKLTAVQAYDCTNASNTFQVASSLKVDKKAKKIGLEFTDEFVSSRPALKHFALEWCRAVTNRLNDHNSVYILFLWLLKNNMASFDQLETLDPRTELEPIHFSESDIFWRFFPRPERAPEPDEIEQLLAGIEAMINFSNYPVAANISYDRENNEAEIDIQLDFNKVPRTIN